MVVGATMAIGSSWPAGAPGGWPVIDVAVVLTVQVVWPMTPSRYVCGVFVTSTLTPRAFWPLTAPGGAVSVDGDRPEVLERRARPRTDVARRPRADRADGAGAVVLGHPRRDGRVHVVRRR